MAAESQIEKGKTVDFNIKSRERLWVLIVGGIIGLVVIVVAGYLVWKSFQVEAPKPKEAQKAELPRMANLPPKKEAIPPPPPPQTAAFQPPPDFTAMYSQDVGGQQNWTPITFDEASITE